MYHCDVNMLIVEESAYVGAAGMWELVLSSQFGRIDTYFRNMKAIYLKI